MNNVCVLFVDEDCACRTIRVMINGQEAELTIIDIPYIEMSVSFCQSATTKQYKAKSFSRIIFCTKTIKLLLYSCYILKLYLLKIDNRIHRASTQMF